MLVHQCDFCKSYPDEDKTLCGTFTRPNHSDNSTQKRDFCLGCFNLFQTLLKMDRQKLLDFLGNNSPHL